ncbi:nucleotidyltransferase family protein [Microbacterium arabinogalactanolyticum]|uniref:nucleotidyltransferase family protein n=1 Tax=Microbacterium arabinogalactanolyticum TaxID=69365 RepID=UPI00255555A7|nr:nucleotidyltransferase family protein [Microbacterium arabinogalactanolyticum]
MGALQETPIPLTVRISLCRAGLQVIADRLGVRMLHIKGAVLDPGIRPDVRGGSDVDVIVDPAGVDDVHRALLGHGWEVYSTFDEGSPFGHAQTYWHQDWGYVDLHRRFPGVGIADVVAFDRLWDGHLPRTVAERGIVVPSLVGQGALFVLNAARGDVAERDEALEYLSRLSPASRAEVSALITELDADVAASVVTGTLHEWRRHRDHALWKAVSEGGSRMQEWWGRVRAARTPGAALRVLLRAPRVNRSRLAHELGRTPTTRDVLVAGLRRAASAAREALGRGGERGRSGRVQ